MSENSKPYSPTVGGGASRQHTKGVILDKINRLHREIDALQTIHDNLNWDALTDTQESVLWGHFISR